MASLMEQFKANLTANRAYKAHVTANKQQDAGKYEEAARSYDQAMALYEQCFRQGCDKSNFIMAYSLLLMRYGRTEEARDVMLKLDARHDLAPEERRQLRINYAVCQWKLGDVDKAIDLMRQATGDRRTGTIYNTLGLFMVDRAARTGEFDEALAFCAEALDYDDEDGDTLDNLGQLHLAISRKAARDGDAEKAAEERKTAVEFYDKALKFKPNQVPSLYNRAAIHHEDGEDEQAKALLKRALAVRTGMLCPVRREDVEALLKEVEGR